MLRVAVFALLAVAATAVAPLHQGTVIMAPAMSDATGTYMKV